MIKFTADTQISIFDISILFFLVASIKALFFFTGFILEDSFIVFRSAFHLIDYGVFSYNLDELNSATTSKIFGLVCAFFRYTFKEYAILNIIFFNTVISFFSSLFFLLSIKNLFGEKILKSRENFYFLIIFIFLNPSISIIGIVGLEFSIIFFFISLTFLAISRDNKFLLILCLFIPFVRIEMIGFILILSFFYLIFFKFLNSFIVFFSGLIGLFCNGFLNQKFDGIFFPGPAVSKWSTLTNETTFSLERILIDLNFWLFGPRSFFIGVYSKFISNFIYTSFALVILSLIIYYLRFLLFKKYVEFDFKYKIYLLTISASIILLPLSYIIGGHIWDWYLYPYSFLSYILLSIFLINLSKFNKYYKAILSSTVIVITLLQFAVLKNIGFQENSYRTVIGKDILSLSEDIRNDTLFLEPAGYIPYYAKIKTFDTVGLASPEIKKYREKDKNNRWWLDFIEEKKPTFILDRSNLYGDYSHDGEYTMSSSERIWFKNNYKLVKEYNYHNYVRQYSGSLEQFYKLGNHAPYFLYKRVK